MLILDDENVVEALSKRDNVVKELRGTVRRWATTSIVVSALLYVHTHRRLERIQHTPLERAVENALVTGAPVPEALCMPSRQLRIGDYDARVSGCTLYLDVREKKREDAGLYLFADRDTLKRLGWQFGKEKLYQSDWTLRYTFQVPHVR